MQEYSIPIFASGRVLRKESMEYVRDFPRDFLDAVYAGYSDGIISGFDVVYDGGAEEKNLRVSGGALIRNGEIVVLKEMSAGFDAFDKNICLKLCFGEASATEDFIKTGVEIKADTVFETAENEIELARFRLARSAKLRKKHEYKGVEDFTTPDNTLNLVHVKYAGPDSPTFSPGLLKIFAKEISSSRDIADVSFALLCLSGSVIAKDCIAQYLETRLGREFGRNVTNQAIHAALIEVVKKRGAPSTVKKTGGPAIFG